MTPDNQPEKTTHIDTGGDFINRDKIIHGDEVLGDKVLGDKYVTTEDQAYNVHGLANPFLGLRAFTYADRAIYAGREQLTQEAVAYLTAPGSPRTILFITGASGSGKSSFAQAALLPELEAHYAQYNKIVRSAVFRPSRQPMVMLQDALSKLHPALRAENLAANTPENQVNMLVIDQFEEVFIQSETTQRDQLLHFLENFPPFIDTHTHVLVTLRIDYVDKLFPNQPLWKLATQDIGALREMSAEQLRNAIQKPLQQEKYSQKRFHPELLNQLAKDASGDSVRLPLLQATLDEIWKQGNLLLRHDYNFSGAIHRRAESIYTYTDHASANPHQKRSTVNCDEIMRILLDLINVAPVSATPRDIRQRRTRAELELGSPERQYLIEELINARLLTASTEIRHDQMVERVVEVIDIIHESLIDNWDRLRQYIDKQLQQLQYRARFKLSLDLWLQNQRNVGRLLLAEIQLAEARALVEQNDVELRSLDAHDFYKRSVEHQEAARQRSETARRRVVYLSIAAIAALIIALAASWLLNVARQSQQRAEIAATGEAQARETSDANALDAIQAKSTAEFAQATAVSEAQARATAEAEANSARAKTERLYRADQLAVEAQKLLNQNYVGDLPILLAREAVLTTLYTDSYVSPNAENILTSAINNAPWRLTLQGHTSAVLDAVFSHDGNTIMSVGDSTVRIWDAAIGKQLHLLQHPEQITSAAINSDGRIVVSGDSKGAVYVWDTNTETKIRVLSGHMSSVNSVAISSDDRIIASASGAPYDNHNDYTISTLGYRYWQATSHL